MSKNAALFQNYHQIGTLRDNSFMKIGILFQKLFRRKHCFVDWEKLLNIWGWRPKIWKTFEITRTIYFTVKSQNIFETIIVTGGFSEQKHWGMSINDVRRFSAIPLPTLKSDVIYGRSLGAVKVTIRTIGVYKPTGKCQKRDAI